MGAPDVLDTMSATGDDPGTLEAEKLVVDAVLGLHESGVDKI